MSASGVGRFLGPATLVAKYRRFRELHAYARSGQDADNPEARAALIRAAYEDLFAEILQEVPDGSLDPFLNYVAAKVAAAGPEVLPDTAPEMAGP